MTEQRQILLVEDNQLNCEMLTRRLRRAGYTVVTAADGKQALALMASARPALVLMDMNLPVMDGWTTCRIARGDPQIRDIPIIALTAHAMDADRRSALAAGCDDYATKPIDFPELLNQIRSLITP